MKKLLAGVVALFFSVAAMAQENPPSGAGDFVRGQQAFKKRDNDGAIRAFERALGENPDLILSHYYLGFAYQRNKSWDEAGDNFATFLGSVDRDDSLAMDLVYYATRQGGLALAKTDRFREAIPYLEEIIAVKPEDKQAQFHLGLALFKNDSLAQAEKQFIKVIELDAGFSEAYFYAGQISFNQQDNGLAKERLEKLLRLEPHSEHAAKAHFTLASIAVTEAETSDDPAEANGRAKTHFEKYLKTEPSGADAEEAKKFLEGLEK